MLDFLSLKNALKEVVDLTNNDDKTIANTRIMWCLNGGILNRDNDFCECPKGWTGKFCGERTFPFKLTSN